MKDNGAVTQVENLYPENVRLISTTDLKGKITSVNQDFVDVCGYSAEELIGASHNIVRHPDMPPAAFADLWENLKANKPWMGLVKNRCKNGDHYWVNAYVTPVFEGGQKIGYQSVRTKPQRDYVENAERLYRMIRAGKAPGPKAFREIHKKVLTNFAVMLLPAVGVSAVTGFSTISGLVGIGCAAVGAGILGAIQNRNYKRIENRAVNAYNSPLACLAYMGDTSANVKTEVAIQALESQQVTLIELLQNSAGNLMKVIRHNNAAAEQNNQSINEQGQEISHLANSITQMSDTIHEVAKNAQETAHQTQAASQEAEQGKQIISQSAISINELMNEVNNASQLINQLSEDTRNISNIINVIEEIAEQTNLLALNAAIEAARAGDSGRGFAVVADEVRSLANRTQTSTSEIESMINRLQDHVQQAVKMMEVSQDHAEKTVAESEQVNVALQNIASTIGYVNDMNTQIATATEEQSAVTEEINRNVANINAATNDINQASQDAAKAGQELVGVAADMESVVSQFRKS
ncbi:MAG: methyl-accepting chemotaxis protein [Amphritea sp.]|nr:methyl-accepting chemotaxis protein [Amphritea sp.]